MLLLRIAEERLQSHLPPQAITPIRPLLRSARRVIKYDDETEGTWLRKVKVLEDAQSFQPPVIRPGVLSAIADALFIDHKVLLRCRSARSRNTEVIVRPLAIIQKGVRTYLVYQTDAGDFQHIALNRLDAAELMQDAFERPENFDLEDYSAKIRLNDARGKTMRLSITSDDPEFVRILSESPFNQTQKIEDEPGKTGSWVITAVVEDSLLLDGWLAEHRGSIISSTKTALRQEEATAMLLTPQTENNAEKRSSRPRAARTPSGEEINLTAPAQKSYEVAAAALNSGAEFGLEVPADLKSPKAEFNIKDHEATAK